MHDSKTMKHFRSMNLVERMNHYSMPLPWSGCTVWTGPQNGNGYGVLNWKRKRIGAHRVAFQLSGQSIPDGMQLDHLCRVRCCVNPAHLEAVTGKENSLRGIGPTAKNAKKIFCKHGHEFVKANIMPSSRPERNCRMCKLERNRIYMMGYRARARK